MTSSGGLPSADKIERNLKGSWPQALAQFFGSILFLLAIRWAFFEPYVIPSGSMIPALLVHDHILVNKFAYGLRVPFATTHLLRWAEPKRGDVIVFRSVERPEIFLVKRVIGLPGDRITLDANSRMRINGEMVTGAPLSADEIRAATESWSAESREHAGATLDFLHEAIGESHPVVMHERGRTQAESGPYVVPPGHLFMMGDNRDNSADSRVWGPLPLDHVLGRAVLIWLSCEETLPDASRLCDPKTVRWKRLFTRIK